MLPLPTPTAGQGSPVDGLNRQWLINGFARHTGWLHPIMTAYAGYGIAVFAGLLLAGWWIARRDGAVEAMAKALWAPLSTLAALAINQPIVRHVAEARPHSSLSHILVLAHRSNDFSFPSDHAVMAGAVAAGLVLISRRLGLIAILAALAMAFARVYIGAHYPRDVAAGLLLGAAFTLAGYALQEPALTRAVARLRISPLRSLLIGSRGDGTPRVR
jgi:membrane-associated phospholipid phosphatase